MTIRIKKPVTKPKLEKAGKKLIENRSEKRGFDAKKFSGTLNGIFGNMKSTVRLQEIVKGLEEVPDERLVEIENLIKSILSQSRQKKDKEPKTLKGIWAKKGFEKIVDLEGEIRKTRIEIQNQLLKKKL